VRRAQVRKKKTYKERLRMTTQEEEARGAQVRKKGKEKEKTLPQQQQCATYRQRHSALI
jgi:hypothetical protein